MSVGVIADEPSARISAHPSGRQSRHRKPSDSAALAMEIMKASVGLVMQLLAMLDRLHELNSKSMISAVEMELWSSMGAHKHSLSFKRTAELELNMKRGRWIIM